MSVGQLLATPEKFDGKRVWLVGDLKFNEGIPYLSAGGAPEATFDTSVCPYSTNALDPRSPIPLQVMKRLIDLPLGVHGVYHRSAQGSLKNCRNGAVRVELVDISFE